MGVPADRVTVTGSVKWDSAAGGRHHRPAARPSPAAMGLRAGPADSGSRAAPARAKRQIILDAYAALRSRHPSLQLVIVPAQAGAVRRSGRVHHRARTMRRRSLRLASGPRRDGQLARSGDRSGLSVAARLRSPATVVLGDTMGELRKFYSLAAVVFVGRSLAAMGGSDMMEVAALAKPIIVGPHNENFADTVHSIAARAGHSYPPGRPE